MSRLQHEHSEYELREQYIVEQLWQDGLSAATLRALLTGLIAASAMAGDKKISDRIKRIVKMLAGTYDPDKAGKRQAVTKEQIKRSFGL